MPPSPPPAELTSPRSPSLKALFRRSRSRPHLAPVVVVAPPSTLDRQPDDTRPKSPSVILSPSTPDFPTVGLPPLPAPPPTELVPAQVLPPSSFPSTSNAIPGHSAASVESTTARPRGDKSAAAMDPTLRHSLALLDSRLAEIEQLGFGSAASVARRASYQALVGVRGEDDEERLVEVDEEEATPVQRNLRLSEPIMAPFNSLGVGKDTSMTSLSSITSSSSEDAFDIADFPSLDQLNTSFELDAPAPSAAARKRSSDLMAFPVPPSLPSIPVRRPSEALGAQDEGQEEMFEQLAGLGQRASVQGLGLFSSAGAGPVTSPLVLQGRSSRSSSRSSRSSLSSKSFDASTLASSAANTSYGQRDKEDEPFPPALPSTLPLFASPSSIGPPPPRSMRDLPAPLDPLAIDIGSAHPALASPFTLSRPTSTAPRSPVERAALSSTNARFASRSSSLLHRLDGPSVPPSPVSSTGRASPAAETYSSDAFQLGEFGVLASQTYASPPAIEFDDIEEELVEPTQRVHEHIRIVQPTAPPSPRAYADAPLPPASSPPTPSTFNTLRRFSSLGLLKKRKSEGVLQQQQSPKQNQQPQSPVASPSLGSSAFSLTKRKSEAALSSLLRSSKGAGSTPADKENSPVPVAPQAGPNKLTRRSVSSPKLSKLFSSPTNSATPSAARPPLPNSPSSGVISLSPQQFSVRPRTLSFGESGQAMASSATATATGSVSSTKSKKRFSMFFNQPSPTIGSKDAQGETVPPLPPTPREHLAAKLRAPAGIVIDVAKANEGARNKVDVVDDSELEVQEPVAYSPAPTLEIAATPVSPADSPLFSPTAESIASNTPISPSFSTFSRAAVPLSEKPLPPCLPAESLSPPASPYPPSTPTSTTSSAHSSGIGLEDISLATFLKATDPDQQLIVKRPARISSFFQPSSVFPPPSSSGESRSRSSSRAETPSSPAFVEGSEHNWSRPTSPALLDALKSAVGGSLLLGGPGLDKQVFPVQHITAFPVHIPPNLGVPSAPTTTESGDGGDDGDSSGEDDYGEGTDGIDSEADEDDDMPLGVVVPGALTAQKSLRISAAKRSRSERKAREQAKKDKEMRELARRTASLLRKTEQGRREDPFELEATAAMVATPPMLMDGHGEPRGPPSTRPGHPALSPIQSVGTYPSCSTITSLTSGGHDSLLPQTDASIERRYAAATGMKRSPSTPLDPMIANSTLTMDSPVLTQEPLPAKPVSLPKQPQAPVPPTGRSRSGTLTRSGTSAGQHRPVAAPPMPTMRPPPAPPVSAPQQPPLARRPSLHPQSSHSSPTSSPATTPQMTRRPSLHPDVHPSGMVRQYSSNSTTSAVSAAPSGTLSRSNTLARNRSGIAPGPTVEQRVYLDAALSQHITVQVNDRTVAGEVVAFGKLKGALGKPATPKEALEGGWALWEVWRGMGVERPVREYELVSDVVKSWENDSAVFIFRRTPLWPILSSHARLHPTMPRTGPVQLEVKKGKWSKRFLELKDGALSYSKSEKGKDSTVLCQLSNFDVFFVSPQAADQLRAPKGSVFAVKSRLTRAHFEEKSEWCHFLSVKTPDELLSWVKTVLEAGNTFARQREQTALGTSTTPATSSPTFSGPLISPSSLASPEAPPVPSLPPTMTPAAAIAAAARNPSRPAPPILAQRSHTLPLGASPADPTLAPSATGLARNQTVIKPSTREWGGLGPEGKNNWVKGAEKLAKSAKQPLVELSR
ncbi:hypothetical protein JCM8097_006301 [Rhodosporidiobolus ruineniae]